MHKNNFITNIGNALIALSFFGMVITYFPVIQAYLLPARPVTIPDGSPSIAIESIKAHAPLILNVNPWDQAEYLKALSNGVAHAAGTALPGENGTVYLFAHSSDAPWRLTRYNTVFFKLNNLTTGDEISIQIDGKKFNYHVREKKVVWPTETEYLTNIERNQLILQTCYPIGTDLKRLLVFADPAESYMHETPPPQNR